MKDEMHVFLQAVVPKRYKTSRNCLHPSVTIYSSTCMPQPNCHSLGHPEVKSCTNNSEGSESMAVSLSVPIGSEGAAFAASTAAYVAPSPDGPGCRLLAAACSPVPAIFAGRGVDPAPVAGGQFAGSAEPLELARSLALRLHASSALLTADTLLLPVVDSLLCSVEIAFIKASSSCLSMRLPLIGGIPPAPVVRALAESPPE